MQYTLAALALAAAGASAARIPRTTCTFSLTATGPQSGVIGQLDDGQNRIGGNLPKGTYTINNGQIVDGQGRGCILTPPTTQFQCDVGATPTGGFSIGSNGELSHDGDHQFYACPATDSEYNLYTTPVEGQDKCVKVGLVADGCYTRPSTSKAPPPPETVKPPPETVKPPPETVKPPPQTETVRPPPQTETIKKTETVHETQPPQVVTKTVHETQPPQIITKTETVHETQPAQTITKVVTEQKECPVQTAPPKPPVETHPAPSQPPVETHPAPPPSPTKETAQPPKPTKDQNACPTNLDGEYQYPHLIVPVNKDEPHKAYGTQYNGKITSSISTIFNFDIPPSYTGTCSLVFLFPQQADLETSSFTFSGDGGVSFKKLKTVATQETTYETVGEVEADLGVQTLTPGSKAVVSTFACPSGQRISFEASATGNIDFEYFQDYNPSPIGAYVTTC